MATYTILVLTGSSEFPFLRLRDWLVSSPAWEDERIKWVVQSGATEWTAKPRRGQVFSYCEATHMRELVESADLIISHAGVGSLIEISQAGVPAIFAIRSHSYGEHVDNHQLQMIPTLQRSPFEIVDYRKLLDFREIALLTQATGISHGKPNTRLATEVARLLEGESGFPRRRRFRRWNGPSKPRIITLLGDDFEEACARLASEFTDWRPTVVVAIATGGEYVADSLLKHIGVPEEEVFYSSVVLQRIGTARKDAIGADRVLSRLPRSASDFLRRVEVLWRERRARKTGNDNRQLQLPDPLRSRLLRGAERVLIVDDSVDSGVTLSTVLQSIQSMGDNDVRTAALTVTFESPMVQPDYFLYQRTLLRLPWAKDVRDAAGYR